MPAVGEQRPPRVGGLGGLHEFVHPRLTSECKAIAEKERTSPRRKVVRASKGVRVSKNR